MLEPTIPPPIMTTSAVYISSAQESPRAATNDDQQPLINHAPAIIFEPETAISSRSGLKPLLLINTQPGELSMRTSHRKLRLTGELNVPERSRPIGVLLAKAPPALGLPRFTCTWPPRWDRKRRNLRNDVSPSQRTDALLMRTF